METSQDGFVHFAVYVRLMEETEYAFLRSRGLCVVLHDDRGTIGFPRLHAEVNVENPLRFDQQVWVTLELTKIDGKQIVYEFEIVDEDATLVATGRFRVASCRFPDNDPPYAILMPEFIEQALTKPV